MLKGGRLDLGDFHFQLPSFLSPIIYRLPWAFTMVFVTAIDKVGLDKMWFVNWMFLWSAKFDINKMLVTDRTMTNWLPCICPSASALDLYCSRWYISCTLPCMYLAYSGEHYAIDYLNQIYPTVAFKLVRPSLIPLNHQYCTCMKSYKTTQAQLTSIKRIHAKKPYSLLNTSALGSLWQLLLYK